MPLVSLEPRVVFGQRTDVLKNAHFITDDEIVYAVGVVLVFQNINTFKQKYLMLPDKNSHLHYLLVSPQKQLVAALVNDPAKAAIHIYDSKKLKRMRTLTLPAEAAAKKIVSMSFSFDERFVVVVSGEPDWMMLAFNWERGKVESSTKANYLTNPTAPVREVICSPVDCSTLAMYGTGLFRLMNMQEAVWRQYGFQKAEAMDICSCCFLTGDRLLLGTADGLLLLVDLGELKFMFDADVVNYINARAEKDEEFVGVVTSSMMLERAQVPEEQKPTTDRAVRALTALKNGFAYSCLPGLVHFFEKISPHKYKKRNEYEIKDKDFRENQTQSILVVTHLSTNVSETVLMATTRRSQLYQVKLWGPDMDLAGRVGFKSLWHALHTGPVKDLAVCYWKPIFMTCGSIDRTVRVWNYTTDSLEMMKQYQEDVHSVSLHPTGLYAAIGFSDKLRFMVVLIDDLQVSREFPIRECPKSSFNTSGNLLAAVNRNIIQIYSVTTFNNLANLKGHSGIIRSLRWTRDNLKLISCGTDGAVYEWDVNAYKRVGEIVNKGIMYWDCAVTANGRSVYAIGTDDYLKEIRGSNVHKMINLNMKNMNRLVISRGDNFMFIAVNDGYLVSVKMPVEEPTETLQFNLHSCSVTQMALSPDDRNLITCSETGTLCIWNLKDQEGKLLPPDKNFTLQYFNEILISKNDLEEKLSSIKDLTKRTYELEMEHAYQLRQTETTYKEKVEDIKKTYAQAIEELKGTLEVLEANHHTELNNISMDMKVMKERHEAVMLELEGKYNSDLIVEYNKILDLEGQKEKLSETYESRLADLQASKERTIEELTRINESKLYNLNKMVEEARDDINKEVQQHSVLTEQIEDDNDREIEELKSRYETTLKEARESNFRLKGESGVLKKKIISSQKEVEMIQMEIINMAAEHEKFKITIRAMEQEILDLKKEISERDLRIQDKERRIYDLKRKDQEYERYKFVLNYRIKELKNQIEPRDKEIKEKKEQIAELEDELDDLQKVNMSLDNRLSTMREKLNDVYKHLHASKSRFKNTISVISRVKTDIHAASGNLQDYKKLRDGVKKLYFKYITDKDFAKARKSDEACVQELRRQKQYLEGIVSTLDKQGHKMEVRHGKGIIYMEMNWTLMDEIYKLRKHLKLAQSKIQDMETLMSVRMAKIHPPVEAQAAIRKSESVIKEEYEIKMEEALSIAVVMREEMELLQTKIDVIETALMRGRDQYKKKPKEGLKFDIPSII